MKLRVIEDGNGIFKVQLEHESGRNKFWVTELSFNTETDAIKAMQDALETQRQANRAHQIRRVLVEGEA